tara:strand:- start:715 stop:1140 length:426 start_codon:yes stop_codon:yes gene_type:complete
MNIAQTRDAIDTLNWNRMDATGGTPTENQRTDLPARLAPHIAIVEALQIPKRFTREIQRQADAIKDANAVIERWQDCRTEPETLRMTRNVAFELWTALELADRILQRDGIAALRGLAWNDTEASVIREACDKARNFRAFTN